VKLVSFQVGTATGTVNRVGAVDQHGSYIDLNAAWRGFLLDLGTTESAADRIASAVFTGNMVDLIEGGAVVRDAADQAVAWALANDHAVHDRRIRFDPAEVTLLPPVARAPMLRDFMAFETHLKNVYPRLGREIPPEWYAMPVYYKGNPGSVGTDGDDVATPPYAEELDYEFELAAVIGTGGKDIDPDQAMEHVFGYMIYNDFSARAIQAREMSVGLGPAKGKDFNNAHVFGPFLVTRDEIPDPYDLRMQCRVNGETRCDERSGTMHWRFEQMIAHASMGEALVPGEIIGSGTVGNGSGMEVDRFLHPGDVIELEVDGLGILRNRIA